MPQNLLWALSLVTLKWMVKVKHHVKFKVANKKKLNKRWIGTITLVTFLIAVFLGYISVIYMAWVSLFGAVILTLLIVLMGVFFDLIGIAVTSASDISFNAMASSKVKGAKEAILIIRNAGAVANFFNDVIGDIAGIISGSATAAIVIKIQLQMQLSGVLMSTLLTGIIAAMTVGGKAIGKELAIKHANHIVYRLGYILYLIKRIPVKLSKLRGSR